MLFNNGWIILFAMIRWNYRGSYHSMKKSLWRLALFIICVGAISFSANAAPTYDPTEQTAALFYDEAQTVYLGNLARRANGVPPLRWNWQLTQAARWYSWDSTENRPEGFCGHQDTLGGWPSDRIVTFGYLGYGGAENAFCGYVSPADAIQGWMNSEGHRANLLDSNSREVGLGYYRRLGDGRGYVTQDFGSDSVYPPLVIENEAPATTSQQVNLYIYDRASGGGFKGLGPASEMQISNDQCFENTPWQSYTPEITWPLASGPEGWRSVYVRSRDSFNRTTTVSDTIYWGANFSAAGLAAQQLSTTQSSVTIYNLNENDLPLVQFSLGWLADDTFDTFGLLWGSGERVNDPAAMGGTAFRLGPPGTYSETSAWVWTTEFFQDISLNAYVRLKVTDNTAGTIVARFSATGGTPLEIRGTDFAASNTYQEFAVPFTFPSSETFLTFQFWRTGNTDVYVDAVSIFDASRAVNNPYTWEVPGGNYRGQGVWLRYTDGNGQFSGIQEGMIVPGGLSASPESLFYMLEQNDSLPQKAVVQIQSICYSGDWQATSSASWMPVQKVGDTIEVTFSLTGLEAGRYTGEITVTPLTGNATPLNIPVTLLVVDHISQVYLPVITRDE
jgi:uncharacterized protein YkwD